MPIQPVEFIQKNRIGFIEGNIIKYICRWRAKGGVEDLEKVRHYIDLLIEMETPVVPPVVSNPDVWVGPHRDAQEEFMAVYGRAPGINKESSAAWDAAYRSTTK